VQIAERIRESTAAEPVEFEEHRIPITVSIGISSDQDSQQPDSRDLLAAADEHLYTAKQSGRNQVRCLQANSACVQCSDLESLD
jgi:diguanylate cyclase (GGDEF)-like protein